MAEVVRTFKLAATIHDLVAGVAFWTAIVLAFTYPVVFFSLDRGYLDPMVLIGLIGLHVVALLLGRHHQTNL